MIRFRPIPIEVERAEGKLEYFKNIIDNIII